MSIPYIFVLLHNVLFQIYFPLLFELQAFYNKNQSHARLAQLVEQLVYTEKVGSSSLSSRTRSIKPDFCLALLYLMIE